MINYRNYEQTRPIEVKGGIKAQSKRGAFGSNWWAKRWTQTLEDFDIGSRLSRGRSYARKGQVMSLDIQRGGATAKVQGSRKEAYDVAVTVQTINPDDWRRLQEAMSEQPIIAASLLSGRMPDNIEETFEENGLSMFPRRKGDLRTHCSCPDDANPCKHVAAVYLLMGEEFSRDPFLIFRLRGMERDELMGPEFRQAMQDLKAQAIPPEPLPEDPAEFWLNPIGELQKMEIAGAAATPQKDAMLVQQLGRFPLWQGTWEFMPTMQAIYRIASEHAVEMLNSEEARPETEVYDDDDDDGEEENYEDLET